MADLIKAFCDCEIPVLVESKRKLKQLLQEEKDITISVLTEIARQDPGFSIHLLRQAGRTKRKEITTLSHAISLISIPRVIKSLNHLPSINSSPYNALSKHVLNIYAMQYQIAYISRHWSILRKESENNELYTAGLNRGFVRFMLYHISPDLAGKLEQTYLTPAENHKAKEKALLGDSVDNIAQILANKWKLPELIRESYSGKHHNPKITGIRLATELMHFIYTNSSANYPNLLIERIAEYIRIPEQQTAGIINKTLVEAIRNSGNGLPYQPLLKIIMSYPSPINVKQRNQGSHKRTTKKTLVQYIQLLRSHNLTTTRELIEIAVMALKDSVGFSRVIFMTLNKDENRLETLCLKQNQKSPDLKHLEISIDLNQLYKQLIKKEQTLLINNNNQHKYIDFLPQALRPLKPVATIITNSFYVHNKLAGCFFVDLGKQARQLSTNDIDAFKQVCKELKAALESTILKNNLTKKVA